MTERKGTPDFFLLFMTIVLVGFGIVMVFSASGPEAAYVYGDALYYTKKQILAAGLGIVSMFVLMNIPYQKWKKGYLPFFFLVLGMLLFVLTQPTSGNRPRSWIDFGFYSIQPAEFAKLAIILYLAALISRKGETFESFKKGLLPVTLMVGFVALLIAIQPDLGSTIVFLGCSAVVIVAGGAKFRQLAAGLLALLAAGFLLMGGSLLGYQLDRFDCFIDPWQDPQNACWQHVQAQMAFGHGGITGAGFGQSVQKLFYLPEAQNDFIFAIIGEELGFIGATSFLILYLLFLWRGIIVSLRCPDPFGSLLGIGIVGMFGLQAFINIGGVTGAIPMTGITLPFISYGGSSLLVSLMSMGILLSVSRASAAAQASPEQKKRRGITQVPEHIPRIRS